MEDAGTITRRIPSRMIATSRTPGGNAISFDRRTACERLLWNKVVRFIWSTMNVPYIYFGRVPLGKPRLSLSAGEAGPVLLTHVGGRSER